MKLPLICITGANSQIGSYLARHYSGLNYPLYLVYHERDERIRDIPGVKRKVDLRDFCDTSRCISSAPETIGVLIHCAAVRSSDAQPLADTDPGMFKEIFDANFFSAYNVLRAVLPPMRSAGFGRVVLFASDITRSGLANGSAYAAAKAAIANMARSAASESVGHNVLINCISPGPVDTNLEEDYSGDYLQFRKDYFTRHIQSSPSHSLVSKAEIRRVVDLLIDPVLRNLCSEEIFISGGKQ
ncbi:MAG: SDR family NAD(P)-dependent oxidoreductase [Candidatus Cloacimonetes bacterium]|nr:SDR family NAD(P)-dependent oxidoreductase [Candidatus Cloacimonadota bacterium]MDD4100021.1 SDR family NAD(P)-dependent oxidoreductase [Candidatus Cloacimonadota bacterium]MDD4805382.1 SDR family NAD(P)-dependent oxidoreductase [Candidatus Cloacimonadota bacterium]